MRSGHDDAVHHQQDAGRLSLRLTYMDENKCSHRSIPWSKYVVMEVTTMDGGGRSKVDIRLHLEDGTLGKPLLGKRKVDIRISVVEKHQAKIQTVPLRNTCAEITAKSLLKEYKEHFSMLDLKTAWLVVRQYSPAIRRDDDIAMVLFCGNCVDMANLTFSAKFDLLEKSIKQVLGKELIAQKYWLFLKKLANEASRLKYLRNNPLESNWHQLKHADSRELQKITEVLRDWSLNPVQMDRMVLPLLGQVEKGGKFYHRFAIVSKVLMKVFAAFSLIHKNELCALNFGDIELLPNGDAQAHVTKFLDEKGKLRYYADGEKRQILCRKSALSKLVTHCFLARKNYVKKSLGRLSDADLRDLPMFWEHETTCKTKVKRISLKTAGKLYNELLVDAQACDLAPKVYKKLSVNIDDIIQYIDIGITSSAEFALINNLKLWAEAIFGLENGELAYNSGIEPVATIDRHYIAWYEVFNQISTAGKLDRLTARYMAILIPSDQRPIRRTMHLTGNSMQLLWMPPADKRGTVRLEVCCNQTLEVTVETGYGHTVQTNCFNDQ